MKQLPKKSSIITFFKLILMIFLFINLGLAFVCLLAPQTDLKAAEQGLGYSFFALLNIFSLIIIDK